MSDVFQALAHPVRREVLHLLRKRPMAAGALARCFDLSKPTLSGHFAVLKTAGLIEAERQGTTILYRLNLPVLEDAIALLADIVRVARSPSPRGRGNPDIYFSARFMPKRGGR